MTDSEWKSIEPHLPKPRKLGRPRQVDLRAVVEAIFYVATTGCQWANLAQDFPAKSTVQGYFDQWRDDGTWETLNYRLVMQAREAAGREASPTAQGQRMIGPRSSDAKSLHAQSKLTTPAGRPFRVIRQPMQGSRHGKPPLI